MGSSIINLDNSNLSAGSLTLTATEVLGSDATPLQANTLATNLNLNTSAGKGIYISANSSIAVASANVTLGDISLSAIGDLTLAGNITGGSHTTLTAIGGALTQSGGVITGAATSNLVITANSIGSSTHFIETNVAAVTANVDDGGIYLSNNNISPLTLSAAAVGVAGSPASLTYNSSNPFCHVFATGNYLGYVVDSGVTTVRFSNVNQVTLVNPNYSAVAKLPNLTISVQNGPYTGNPYSATAQINGAGSLDGITPQITYYSGTIVNPRYKLSTAPVNAGVYTAVATYPGDATWVSEAVSAIMTISPATASPWQNPVLPEDVNGETGVGPLDALVLVNDLNQNRPRSLIGSPINPPPFLDVNGDRYVSLLDVLLVINYLIRNQSGGSSGSGGEGEQSSTPVITGSVHPNDSALRLLSFETGHNNSLPTTRVVEKSGPAIQSQGKNRFSDKSIAPFETTITSADETETSDALSLQTTLDDRDKVALRDLFFSAFDRIRDNF